MTIRCGGDAAKALSFNAYLQTGDEGGLRPIFDLTSRCSERRFWSDLRGCTPHRRR